ncbi:hypothetical protein CYMTET_40369 [Cymbomonas tetramitiformis]|uniref:Uncharacterized protein n=1 Tax=Cymbomonas tetramitiformis TaxID=36881 RepID=A0AAE0C869_9CHLO|nr:hypothetical protein CYMTET_40369 [Cymbomonas tetramitiformis]
MVSAEAGAVTRDSAETQASTDGTVTQCGNNTAVSDNLMAVDSDDIPAANLPDKLPVPVNQSMEQPPEAQPEVRADIRTLPQHGNVLNNETNIDLIDLSGDAIPPRRTTESIRNGSLPVGALTSEELEPSSTQATDTAHQPELTESVCVEDGLASQSRKEALGEGYLSADAARSEEVQGLQRNGSEGNQNASTSGSPVVGGQPVIFPQLSELEEQQKSATAQELSEPNQDVESDFSDYASSFETIGSAQLELDDSGRPERLVGEPEAVNAESSGRRRPALDGEWKHYRRGVEWRCRWLELRMQDLQQQAVRYEKLEQALLSETASVVPSSAGETLDGLPVASATPESAPHLNSAALKRRRRRKRASHSGEDPSRSDNQAPHHPILSSLCKNADRHRRLQIPRQSDVAGGSELRGLKGSQARLLEQWDLQAVTADELSSSDSEVSTLALYEQMEELQRRVRALRDQLRKHQLNQKPAASPVVSARNGRGTTNPSPNATGLTSASGPRGRKRDKHEDDQFNINNIVTPVNMGHRSVERVHHVNIQTPTVRDLASEAPTPIPAPSGISEDSSDEDTSDEAYLTRHEPMETAEKQRNLPFLPASAREGSGSGTGRRRGRPAGSGKGRGRGRPPGSGAGALTSKVKSKQGGAQAAPLLGSAPGREKDEEGVSGKDVDMEVVEEEEEEADTDRQVEEGESMDDEPSEEETHLIGTTSSGDTEAQAWRVSHTERPPGTNVLVLKRLKSPS